MLQIDTRPAPPRPVGGGLDDPGRLRRSPWRPPARREPVVEGHVVAPVVPAVEPVHNVAGPVALDRGPEAELADVRAALLALVPAGGGSTLDLVRQLGHRLDGHTDCHRLIAPDPGTLGLDEVRAQCAALIRSLSRPGERTAALDLLTLDLLALDHGDLQS